MPQTKNTLKKDTFQLAVIIMFVFVLLPITILMFYPFSCFHKILSVFPGRWYILHTFVNSFYGCYKDGTEPGSRDYRWFASVFFITRVFQYLIYTVTDTIVLAILVSLTLVIHTILLITLQPFLPSCSHYNVINIVFLQFLMAILVAGNAAMFSYYAAPEYFSTFISVSFVALVIPLLCIATGTLYWVYLRRKFGLDFITRIKARMRSYSFFPELSESLPDRIEHSEHYVRRNLSHLARNINSD